MKHTLYKDNNTIIRIDPKLDAAGELIEAGSKAEFLTRTEDEDVGTVWVRREYNCLADLIEHEHLDDYHDVLDLGLAMAEQWEQHYECGVDDNGNPAEADYSPLAYDKKIELTIGKRTIDLWWNPAVADALDRFTKTIFAEALGLY